MSRGLWNYQNESLKSDIFGWFDDGEAPNVFEDQEINGIILDMFWILYEFDSYKSGDNSRETYINAIKAFKDKWFGKRDERLKAIVEEELERVKTELMEVIG